MSTQIHPSGEGFTYGDYVKWPEGERWELIDGVAYDMTPAPLRRHQDLSRELFVQVCNFLKDKPCKAYDAPFDVRLPEGDEADDLVPTVVQPDIAVICDLKKLDDRGCRGAPDFVVEVVSPSTSAKDQIQKTALYERHGVREYWVIHPTDKLLTVRLLGADAKYGVPVIREGKGRIEVATLPGLEVDLDAVFAE
ncbi:MAG: Uma2 family endonuclease [Candidatus Sumerlaeota bacterium]|nr:Uma2 family endonuclease [Candidatus Sumerlaeota bacterium]